MIMKTDDKLEKFVRNNRQDFDNLEVPEDLFSKIEKNLSDDKPSKIISLSRKQIMKIAAAVFVPILVSYLVIGQINHKKIVKLTAEIQNSKTDNNPLVGELIESETYYNGLIAQKTKEIYASLADQPELIEEIDNMLNDIDNSYKMINADFNENVNSESVMTAMVSCQRQKLQSLEEIYLQIKQAATH